MTSIRFHGKRKQFRHLFPLSRHFFIHNLYTHGVSQNLEGYEVVSKLKASWPQAHSDDVLLLMMMLMLMWMVLLMMMLLMMMLKAFVVVDDDWRFEDDTDGIM